MVVVSDLNKNFSGLMDLLKERYGSADLRTPIHPPPPPSPPPLAVCLYSESLGIELSSVAGFQMF